jgi:hypothetical protein
MRLVLLIALVFLTRPAFAQATNDTNAPILPAPPASTGGNAKPAAPPSKSPRPTTTAQMQATIDKLTQSNRDLLDLLKQQQAVLQDIQYDRRQQSRHIQSLEERLEQALQENAKLQAKVASLSADAAVRPAVPLQPLPNPLAATNAVMASTPPPTKPTPPPLAEPPPPPPKTYLPPPESEGMAGTKSWHRLFTLKGKDGQKTDFFHIEGRTWRVLWHNQDPDDKKLKGTSGLFIDAFPKDDTIPQHACAKVGTGGDSAELDGPGNYYLRITASGGSWELAVEDFR